MNKTSPKFFFSACAALLPLFFSMVATAQLYTAEQQGEIRTKAAAGNPLALYQFGRMLEEGVLEKQNLKKALKYYQDAAAGNIDSAQFALGRFHLYGIEVPENAVVAKRYFEQALGNGHALAGRQLAQLYQYGKGVEPDLSQATAYYIQAYDLGDKKVIAQLQNLPLEMYSSHPAVIEFRARQGNAENEYLLGRMYLNGEGEDKDPELAYYYTNQAAQKGLPQALLQLGDIYQAGVHVNRNLRLAAAYYVQAANRGQQEAIGKLDALELDKLLDTNDTEYQLYLAGRGKEAAQYALYKKYAAGDGVKQDETKAFEYLQKAAVAGYEPAIVSLAEFYVKGSENTPPDAKSAFQWYRKAAFKNIDSARYKLAELYLQGKGTEADTAKAVRYYLLAANAGLPQAESKMKQLPVSRFVAPNDVAYVTYLARNNNVEAQRKIAQYYANKNSSETIYWLKQLALQADAAAMVQLGDVFWKGKYNAQPDTAIALNYYQSADKLGEPDAVKALATYYTTTASDSASMFKALSYANKYLAATSKTNRPLDLGIYYTLAKLNLKQADTTAAIENLNEYVSRYSYTEHPAEELVHVLSDRGALNLQQGQLAASREDFEVALKHLEVSRENPAIASSYQAYERELLYGQAKAVLAEGNTFKACDLFLKAQKRGRVVEEQFKKICIE